MKRITISILIGTGFFLLAFVFLKLLENKARSKNGISDLFKKSRSIPQKSYKAGLQIMIGNGKDDNKIIERTKYQILERVRDEYKNFSAIKLDKNTYRLNAEDVTDTNIFKKLITESIKIEFTEIFTLDEIAESFEKANSKLIKSDKKAADSAKDKLSVILAQEEYEQMEAKKGFAEFINFSQSYITDSGKPMYPAALGHVKIKDTFQLHKLLNDTAFLNHFPDILRFAFGSYDDNSSTKNPFLALYALKIIDQSFNPNPTHEQIIDATSEFEPVTGNPMIAFDFNSSGAEAWYLMTKRNIGRPIAIVVNNVVLSSPFVESAIEGGKTRITGSFSVEETRYMSKMFKSRPLLLPVKITESSFVASKKSKKTIWVLMGVFLFISTLSYGVSFLIKPASKS
jgi:SecD/SecF fusion protein